MTADSHRPFPAPGPHRYGWAIPPVTPNTPLKVDVAVIGAGSGGLTAALLAAATGQRVLLIERARTGGECTFSGCIPSKALLALSRTVHAARRGAALGLSVTGDPDWKVIRATLHRIIDSFEDVDSPGSIEARGVQVIGGEAAFVSPHVLEATRDGQTRTVMAGKFVLATGAETTVPDIDGLDDLPFLTSDTESD